MFNFKHEVQDVNLIITALEHKVRDMQLLIQKLTKQANEQLPAQAEPTDASPTVQSWRLNTLRQ